MSHFINFISFRRQRCLNVSLWQVPEEERGVLSWDLKVVREQQADLSVYGVEVGRDFGERMPHSTPCDEDGLPLPDFQPKPLKVPSQSWFQEGLKAQSIFRRSS